MRNIRATGEIERFRTLALGICCASFVITFYAACRIFRIPNYDSIGSLPYKDAIAWNLCARTLASQGTYPDGAGNWCYRRPLFSELISILFRAVDSNTFVLGFLAAIFAIALLFFVFELSHWVNFFWVVGISLFTIFLWALFGNNLFLSEALAIPLGTLLAASLLNYFRTNNFHTLIWVAIVYSTIQNLRPSNFFLVFLPLLLAIWSKEKLLRITYVVFATILPFLAMKVAGTLMNISEFNNAGNAWSTLYGLIRGNADWRLAYSNLHGLPELSDYATSLEIQKMTIQAFKQEPLGAIKSVAMNIYSMFTGNHPFFLPDNFNAGWIGTIFSILLLFLLLMAIRNIFNFYSSSNRAIPWTYLYLLLTTVISFGIFWKSEPARVMSAGLPLLSALTLVAIQPIRVNNSARIMDLSIRSLVSPLLIAIAIPALVISNHSPANHSQADIASRCSGQKFKLVSNTISSQDVGSVRKLGIFEWERGVSALGSGFLVIGVAKIENSLCTVRILLKDAPVPGVHYQFNEKPENLSSLKSLGFREASIYNF